MTQILPAHSKNIGPSIYTNNKNMIILKHLLKEIENSEDYHGTHKAPDKSNGSPLYTVTSS